MSLEFELKFRANPEILEKLNDAVQGQGETFFMHTVYYDTPGGALSARRYTLRKRMENDLAVCTLKTPAGGLERGEYQVLCHSIEKAIPELCKLSGVADLQELTREGLVPVCGARFTRIAKTVAQPDCVVELALDRGVLVGGGREIPLYEVEVELKEGSRDGAIAYAGALAALYGLQEEPKSKFCRALDLAEGV